MTVRVSIVALLLLCGLTPTPARAQAPAAPQDAAPADAEPGNAEPGGASVLRVDDVADQIVRVHARIRHTTVIQLPAHETILDFIVGDSEYWHLTGAANLAFLKPIGERVTTNVALVCESGRNLYVPRDRAGRAPASGRPHPRRRRGTSRRRPRARVRRAFARGRVPADGGGQPPGGDCGADRGRGPDRGHAPGTRPPRSMNFARPIPRGCNSPTS